MEQELSWEAPEYFHTEKTPDWFWVFGIIVVAIVIVCILFSNILLGIFIALASVVIGMYAARPPKVVRFELKQKGVFIHDNLYPYSSLDSFWIEAEDHHPRIIIKSKKLLMPYIIVPLGTMDDKEVRDFLLARIPEVEHKEPLLQRVMEYLGF